MNGKTNNYKEKLKSIIQDGDAKQLVETARDLGEKLANGNISSSQIRNIYGTSKKIELGLTEDNKEESYKKLILLKPKIAYAYGRLKKDKKKHFQEFKEYLDEAIDCINGDYDYMKNFFDFFEAILAYHRFYHKEKGGRKS